MTMGKCPKCGGTSVAAEPADVLTLTESDYHPALIYRCAEVTCGLILGAAPDTRAAIRATNEKLDAIAQTMKAKGFDL